MSILSKLARGLAALGAVAVIGAAAAQTTASQSVGTTVTATNTLAIDAGGTLSFTPSIGTADSDATTSLSFESNDGSTYRISVVANTGGWSFQPSVTGKIANTYPVLSFQSATATAGTAVTTAANLINADNTLGAAKDVVTGITNAAGTATVTLQAAITQTVVAGSYSAGLTYSLTSP